MEVHSQFVELACLKSWLDLQDHINYQVVYSCNSSTNITRYRKETQKFKVIFGYSGEFKVSLMSVKPVSVIQAGFGSKGLQSQQSGH